MKPTLERLRKWIEEADAIVIGAGAGLSSAAGFEYGGAFFKEHFPEMVALGYRDMYAAGFHPFPSSEEKWAYWAKHIFYCRYQGAKQLYKDLLEVVGSKNYFVITTNVDHQFQLAGFDKRRLFYTQGDYGLFQCAVPCHHKTYDNEITVRQMIEKQKDHRIPPSLIPICPVCGEEMTTNLRVDGTFVQDEGWAEASGRYADFLSRSKDKKVLFLELGVGFNTPGIIKAPFIQMTQAFPSAHYAVINQGGNYLPKEIEGKSMIFDMDLAEAIAALK